MITISVWQLVLGIVGSLSAGCCVGLVVCALMVAAKRGEDGD